MKHFVILWLLLTAVNLHAQSACAITEIQPVAFNAEGRGGTTSLVGFPEYTSPSTPPKRYRTKTLSGSVAGGVFTDSGCTIPAKTFPYDVVSATTLSNPNTGGSANASANITVSGLTITVNWTVSGSNQTRGHTFLICTSASINDYVAYGGNYQNASGVFSYTIPSGSTSDYYVNVYSHECPVVSCFMPIV